LVGVCRHLATVVRRYYGHDGRVRSSVYTTLVSIVDLWSIQDGHVHTTEARRSCP